MSKPANRCRKPYHLAGTSLAAVALAMASATAVSAAEPVRLMAPVDGVGSVAPAVTIHTEHQTAGIQWPAEWTRGGVPEMTPCTTKPAPAGAILHSVIRAKGDLRRCV